MIFFWGPNNYAGDFITKWLYWRVPQVQQVPCWGPGCSAGPGPGWGCSPGMCMTLYDQDITRTRHLKGVGLVVLGPGWSYVGLGVWLVVGIWDLSQGWVGSRPGWCFSLGISGPGKDQDRTFLRCMTWCSTRGFGQGQGLAVAWPSPPGTWCWSPSLTQRTGVTVHHCSHPLVPYVIPCVGREWQIVTRSQTPGVHISQQALNH